MLCWWGGGRGRRQNNELIVNQTCVLWSGSAVGLNNSYHLLSPLPEPFPVTGFETVKEGSGLD